MWEATISVVGFGMGVLPDHTGDPGDHTGDPYWAELSPPSGMHLVVSSSDPQEIGSGGWDSVSGCWTELTEGVCS